MKRRITTTKLFALTLVLCALAITGFSLSVTQTGNGQTSSTTEVRHIVVTADDIAGLPPGKSYVMKVGPGTLSLPNSSSSGLSKPGAGAVVLSGGNSSSKNTNTGNTNSGGSGGGIIKVGPGTLAVYDFRSERPIDFSRVDVQTGDDMNHVKLQTWVQQHRPAGAFAGWPFKRLLVGPAREIAQVEGWKASTTPGSAYICEAGKFCGCNGVADCHKLALSDACASAMNCDGKESNIICYCTAR